MNPRVPSLAVLFALVVAGASRAEPVDFDRDIRPILSDKCYACHGPDAEARQADLRLDTKEGALGDDGGGVFVPSKPDASEALGRIFSNDPDEQMPPPDSKRMLSAEEKRLLRQWVAEGAVWNQHWAFAPRTRPRPPQVADATWPRNAIDRFVLSRLVKAGLEPSPAASRETLIRRVTLDLTGLPPTPAEVDAFLADASPDAYEKVVERLLASPRYGERMAWDWLDAARYADTDGFQGDPTRTMWPWRDWLIAALNDNIPFDRFTIEMLAGDLLPSPAQQQVIATGFHRNHMYNGEGGRIAEETRVENVFDRAETTSTVWLGLTMTCARCHDHKFDPIAQREYYQLFAFFNNTSESGSRGGGKAPPTIDYHPGGAKAAVPVMVMDDLPADRRRKTTILFRGLYDKPLAEVSAGTPAFLPPLSKASPPNRLALARWLVDLDNPLTARVTVNRYWQTFFGAGLVTTSEDFGRQGSRPSHPLLLDWLAGAFIDSGWDVKAMHRMIVTSATYRQASRITPEQMARDRDNRLLARGARYRMPSWMLRDQALAAGGLLGRRIGGPSIKPYQPEGVWAEATFGKIRYQPDAGENLYRRSLYIFWRRIVGPTMLFDSAKRQTCEVKPARTNTPLHALTTLNDTTFVEASRAMAQRVMHRATTPEERIAYAFRLAATRTPEADELRLLVNRWQVLRAEFAAAPSEAAKLLAVGDSPRDGGLDPADHASYTVVCSLLLNLDEVLTRE